MLRRIKWKEPTKDEDEHNEDEKQIDEEDEPFSELGNSSKDNKCHLIWEGVVAETQFDKFKAFYDVRTEYEGRKIFQDKK